MHSFAKIALFGVLASGWGGALWGDHWVKWKEGRQYVPREGSWDHANYGNIFLYTPDGVSDPKGFNVGKVAADTVSSERSCEMTFELAQGSAGCWFAEKLDSSGTDKEYAFDRGVSCYLTRTPGASSGTMQIRDKGVYQYGSISSGLTDDALLELKLSCTGLAYTKQTWSCTCKLSKDGVLIQSVVKSDIVTNDGDYYGMLAQANSWYKVKVSSFHMEENVAFKINEGKSCQGTTLEGWDPDVKTRIPSSEYAWDEAVTSCFAQPLCNAIQVAVSTNSVVYKTGVLNLQSNSAYRCYVKEIEKCPAPPKYFWLLRPDECQAVECDNRCDMTPIGQSELISGNRLTEDMNLAMNKLDAVTNGVDFAIALRASVMTGLSAVALGAGPLGIFAGVLGAVVGSLSATPEQLIAELTTEINSRLASVQDCIQQTSNQDWAARTYIQMKELTSKIDTELTGTAGLAVHTVHGKIQNAWSDCIGKKTWFESAAQNTAQRNMMLIPAADLYAETCWALSVTYISFLGEQTTRDSGDWTASELDAEVYKVAQEVTTILSAAAIFAHAVRSTMERDIVVTTEMHEYTKPPPITGWNSGDCKLPRCKLNAAGLDCAAEHKYLETCRDQSPFAKHWIGARYLDHNSYRPPCQKIRTRFIDKHSNEAANVVLPLAKLAYAGCSKISRISGQEACVTVPSSVAAAPLTWAEEFWKWARTRMQLF